MNDLISRSALLEAFGEEPLVWDSRDREDVQMRNDWLDYTKLVKEAPAVDAGPKWISVKDRLPELIPCNAGTAYSEAVIVWTTGRKAMVAVWDGIDFLCAADYWEAWGERITHWMPLPEPPKEE